MAKVGPCPFETADDRHEQGPLIAYLQAFKNTTPQPAYSYAAIARKLKLRGRDDVRKAMVHKVFLGRKPFQVSWIERWVHLAGLDPDEAAFFRHLVSLSLAPDPTSQSAATNAMAELRALRAAKPWDEGWRAVVDGWVSLVAVLLSKTGALTEERLRRSLLQAASPQRVREAVATIAMTERGGQPQTEAFRRAVFVLSRLEPIAGTGRTVPSDQAASALAAEDR